MHVSFLAACCFADGSVRALFTLQEIPEYRTLGDVVFETALLSLEEHGLEVVTLPAGAEAPEPAASAATFASLVESYDADFVLSAGYEVDGDSVTIDLTWLDGADKSTAFRVTASGRIDLSLDRLITDTVRRMLDTSAESIDEQLAAVESTRVQPEAEPDAASEGPSRSAATPESVLREPGSPGRSSKEIPALGNFLEVSTGFSAFVTVGNASSYSTLGYNPMMSMSYLIGLARPSTLNIGLESGVNILEMKGISLSARVLIIPVGAHIGYTYMAGGSLEVTAGLSGGPALFVLKPSAEPAENLGWECKMKLGQYATADAGVLIHLGKAMGVHLAVGYDAYFEGSAVIMGFTPAVKFYYRL